MTSPFASIVSFFIVLALSSQATAQRTGSRLPEAPPKPPVGAVTQNDVGGENPAVQAMSVFSRCVAIRDRKRAEALLQLPYQSEEQATAAAKLAQRNSECLAIQGSQLRFSDSSFVGGIAEGLVHSMYPNLDQAQLIALTEETVAAAGISPRSSAEDFVLCVAARDPRSVFGLISSELGGRSEVNFVRTLTPHLGPCLPAGASFELTTRSVRLMAAVGLYRIMPVLASSTTVRSN